MKVFEAVGLWALGGAAGCGPVLSTMTPARVLEPRGFQFNAGGSASVPLGQLVTVVDGANSAIRAVETGGSLTDAQVNELATNAVGLVLSPPSVTPEFQLRLGLGYRLEAGLRSTSGAWRLDGRWQFLDRSVAPLDASVGVGLSYGAAGFSLANDIVKLDDYRQFAVEVPVLFGWSGQFGHFWFGPKLMFSTASVGLGLNLNDMNGDGQRDTRLFDASVRNIHYGLQVGGALGYRWLFATFELTVAGLSARGSLALGAGAPTALSYGGLVLAPAFGVMLRL
ncbi:MAG: hypothetical protein HY909_08495 [Deltaproteobacteria bacterium]|nr:hypothetical protein [Deltaproteobacteria bacterium]